MMILPVFIALIMLKISWQKWPEILVDFGRELYIPWQISSGSVLYKDIVYFNGPFSPYLNTFLFKTFGVNLITLAVFNIAVIFILAYVIYRFYALAADKTTAALTASVFLTLFAFAGKNYNFVCPYSHEMTHGVFLSLLAVYLFLIYLRGRSRILPVIIGALAGSIFLTKMEIFLAVFPALICGFSLFMIIYKAGKKEAVRLFALFFLGFFLPICAFAVFLLPRMGLSELLTSLAIPYRAVFETGVASITFYRNVMGFDNPALNIMKMLLAAVGYILLTLFVRLTARAIGRIDKIRSAILRPVILFITALLFVLGACWINTYIPDSEIFRALPLAMLGSVIYLFISLGRSRADRDKTRDNLALLVMAIFGLLLLSKIILNVSAAHYGFALALPAVLLLTKLFVCDASRGAYLRPLALSLVGITLFFNIFYVKEKYDRARFPVGSGKDAIFIIDSPVCDGRYIRRALKTIERVVGKDETFVVLPEGVMLNYLTRRRNPSPYINFMPLEIEIFGEEIILGSLVKSNPDYVILVERKTTEYGSVYFGRDYGKKIFEWVKENYAPVALMGKEPLDNRGFGISISRRVNGKN